MVEIEGHISNTSLSMLIDPSALHSYVSPKIVDVCKLGKVKHDKPWLVQLAIVKDCEVNLNGFLTRVNVNIIPLGLYDVLISMDSLGLHYVMLAYIHKSILCTYS